MYLLTKNPSQRAWVSMPLRSHYYLKKLISSISYEIKTKPSFPSLRSGRQAHSWFVNDYVLFMQVRNTEKNRNCWRRNQLSIRRTWFLKLEGPEKPPRNNRERRKHRLCDTSENLPAKWAHFSTMFRKFCFQLFIGSIKQLSWFADSIFILIYFAKFLL